MKTIQAMLAFNRGVVASKALARIDLEKLRLAAEIQENWMPDVLGSMSLRPGFEYKCATYLNRKTRGIPFVFASDDTAIIEMTDSIMRVLIDGIPISIPAVSSSITNGTFNSNLSGWTNADGGGCVSAWKTGGYMSLKGTGFAFARERQQVTVSGGDSNIEHVLKMRIYRGVITLKVGTTSGGNEYFEYSLTEGDHSLSFVPTGSFWIEISASTQYESLVDYITIDTGGVFSISSPYEEAYLDYIRFDQSADVVFLACKDHSPYKIERRSTRSWSIVKYAPNDGPFRDINISAVRMTPSATTGDITLTASSSFFKSSHVGGLIKITSSGQLVTGSLSGIGQFTNYIRVTGTGSSQRQFTITRSGTWVGTLRVQRSVAEPGSWVDVLSYTTNGSVAYNDGLDNQIIYYRIGFDTGDYTSGTATVSLEYSSGSIDGIVRISGYTSNTSASAIVVKELGGTSSTADWYEGEWSDYRGWPSAVCLYEGRLWMAGKTKIWGSVSDAYSSIDIDVEGDSGAISRSIGSGAVDNINFLIPLQRLIIGTLGSEIVAKSSSLDEPLTPTAFSLKDSSTYGSKGISPIKLDSSGLFVHRGGTKLLEISLANGYDYSTKDLNLLNPDICLEGITRLGVQRMPDTRAHCILNDGTVALLVYDAGESVQAWFNITTSGVIEDVVVLPDVDSDEDIVYYCVKRSINGSEVRYWEKWARQIECIGGLLNKQADAFFVYSGTPTNTITGLEHLEGEQVVIWADGSAYSSAVSSGSITIPEEVSNAVVGLGYQAVYKSAKLAYGTQLMPLTQRKRVNSIAFVLENTHKQGLQFGQDLDHLDYLPQFELEDDKPDNYIWDKYDNDSITFNGNFSNDPRICLVANAPKPCTVLAAVIGIDGHEKG